MQLKWMSTVYLCLNEENKILQDQEETVKREINNYDYKQMQQIQRKCF